ncbi:Solute carrier family 22 member 24 [Penaeus vannamei]|uniref:Solute carrier family 22 member 24 n=1 Tax=Penaeus vannamei TaxID=6689 RepID=A0A3R7P429_PENVA|nr:Solute carrier family 22 member 24 [Penaeus vannamei]
MTAYPPPRGFSLTTYHTLGGAFLAPEWTTPAAARGRPRRSCRPKRLTATRVQLLRAELVLGPGRGACVEWDFDNSTFSSTVGTEVIFDSDRLFQLACGWEYLRSTYQSIYMFGVTIGAPFNGVLADRYGRKMMAVGLSPTPPWPSAPAGSPTSRLSCSRASHGRRHPTIQKTGYILGMEVADPKWRTHIGIALFLPWALGLMAWGGFAYLVREWRMLQLTVSLLCLAFLPTLW